MKVDPEYLAKEKAALRRRFRKAVLFNEREIKALDEYCRRYRVKSKSGLIRQALMKEVLNGLEENNPSLFE